MATSANQQQASIYLPAQQTIGNQAIKPVQNNPVSLPEQNIDPVTGRPVDQANFGMNPSTPQSTSQTTTQAASVPNQNPAGGLMQNITMTQPVKPDAPQLNFQSGQYQNVTGEFAANAPTANVPTISWTPKEFTGHNYSAEQTKEEYRYDPRSESMVKNQLVGLLDPNSDLMRRAIANANAYSAGRGLQSSSIATGAAQAAMIDRALPIAQQDADTNRQTDQIGWNQSFTAEQNNADRRQQLTAINAQGSIQNQLQNNQLSFQQASQQAQMKMQAEMQNLQYLQSLGMLDAQGQQRFQELQEQQRFQGAMQDLQFRQQLGTLDYQGQQQLQQMERNAQLNQQRDYLMQQFQNFNMDKQYLQQLETARLQWQRDDEMFAKNIDANAQAQYRASTAEAYNRYLEQVSAVYGNPNMTPDQQKNAAIQLEKQWQSNLKALQAIFGFAAPAPAAPLPGTGGSPSGPVPGDWNGLPPNYNGAEQLPSPTRPVTDVRPIQGGSSGGLMDQLTQPVDRITPIINDPRMNWAIQ